jgi:hypothetical protein
VFRVKLMMTLPARSRMWPWKSMSITLLETHDIVRRRCWFNFRWILERCQSAFVCAEYVLHILSRCPDSVCTRLALPISILF